MPNTPHAKHRYESAMKHVEAAKAAGKSSEEIHAIFKKVMEFDIKDVEKLPADGPHAKYRSIRQFVFRMFFTSHFNHLLINSY